MSVFPKRLKEARLRAGITQEQLGVLAGIDEMSASARMNQYERGKHAPDWLTMRKLSGVLAVPVCYFFAEDDDAAELLIVFHRLSAAKRVKALEMIKSLP